MTGEIPHLVDRGVTPLADQDVDTARLSRRNFLWGLGAIVAAPLLAACLPEDGGEDNSEIGGKLHDMGLRDPVALERGLMVMSTFENSTTELKYDYAKNIGDGRGITAGPWGFCSGTGDMFTAINTYTKMHKHNPLAQFLPRLREINNEFARTGWSNPIGSTEGLDGLIDAWKQTSRMDEDFNTAQRKVFENLYRNHALKRAEEVETADGQGIVTAAGQLAILDAIIQHGENDEHGDQEPQRVSKVERTHASNPPSASRRL